MMTRRTSLMGLATLATSGLSSCSLMKRAETVDTPSAPASPRPQPAAPMPPRSPLPPGAAARVPTTIAGQTRTVYTTCRVPGPFVALTFDDGPDPEDTPRLLNILKARDVKATFFVIGRNARAFPKIVERTHAEGHELANHSMTHPTLSKLGDAAVARELNGCSNAIADALGGHRPQVFRPPYGAFTARQKEWAHREFGLPSILWSVDPLDWKIRNSAHVSGALIRGASNGGILLAHDIHPTTVAAMPTVVDTLLGRGYQFVTMGQLINMENGAGAPPPVLLRFTAGSM
jgi:peptidoglycan/xylan/chitin deacetylase (PgdA/CDA1 family)